MLKKKLEKVLNYLSMKQNNILLKTFKVDVIVIIANNRYNL